MKLKKIFAVILACCIAFTCLVVPASASSLSVSSNTARYYAYLYELVLQYKNKEITLDTLLANAYNEYMNTGADNLEAAFTKLGDVLLSLGNDVSDKWKDWIKNDPDYGGIDDSELGGYDVCLKVYSNYSSNKKYLSEVYYGNKGEFYGYKKDSNGNQSVHFRIFYSKHLIYNSSGELLKEEIIDSVMTSIYYYGAGRFTFLGNWVYADDSGTADDLIEPFPDKQIPNFDDDSVPDDDLIDFLEDLLNDLMLKFPDLSTIEGLLRAILAKLGTLDSDNDNELLMQILTAIQALKNNGETADNSELLKTLEELKNALAVKDGEKVSSLAELLSQLVQNQIRRPDIIIDSSLYNQRYALIETKLLGKFSFISEIKNFVQYAIDSYSNTENSPTITIDLFDRRHTIDFSAFDNSINLIRWVIAAFIYLSYAFATFRKIPSYINGGDNQ